MNESEVVTSEMAMTNAIFDHSQSDILDTHYDDDRKEISFKAAIYLHGDSEPEKVWCGDKITVDVEGTLRQEHGDWEVADYAVTGCRSNLDEDDG